MNSFLLPRFLPIAVFTCALAGVLSGLLAAPDGGGTSVKLTLSQAAVPALAAPDLGDDGSKPLRATFVVTNGNTTALHLHENAINDGEVGVVFRLLDARGQTVWQTEAGGQIDPFGPPSRNTPRLAPGKSWRASATIERGTREEAFLPGYYTVAAEVVGDPRFSAQTPVEFNVPQSRPLPAAPLIYPWFANQPTLVSAGDYDERLIVTADVYVDPEQEGTVKIGPVNPSDEGLALAVMARKDRYDYTNGPDAKIERFVLEVPRKEGVPLVTLNGFRMDVPASLSLAAAVTGVSVAPSKTTPGWISVQASGGAAVPVYPGALRLSEKPPVDGVYDCVFFEGRPIPNPNRILVFPPPPNYIHAAFEFAAPPGFRGVRVIARNNTLTKLLP